MDKNTENNYAFIDSQNLNLGINKLNWKLDFKKFRIYLSDGDFYCLVKYLYEKGKLSRVISPDVKNCSKLLKKTAKEKIVFMDNLRNKLEYIAQEKSTA